MRNTQRTRFLRNKLSGHSHAPKNPNRFFRNLFNFLFRGGTKVGLASLAILTAAVLALTEINQEFTIGIAKEVRPSASLGGMLLRSETIGGIDQVMYLQASIPVSTTVDTFDTVVGLGKYGDLGSDVLVIEKALVVPTSGLVEITNDFLNTVETNFDPAVLTIGLAVLLAAFPGLVLGVGGALLGATAGAVSATSLLFVGYQQGLFATVDELAFPIALLGAAVGGSVAAFGGANNSRGATERITAGVVAIVLTPIVLSIVGIELPSLISKLIPAAALIYPRGFLAAVAGALIANQIDYDGIAAIALVCGAAALRLLLDGGRSSGLGSGFRPHTQDDGQFDLYDLISSINPVRNAK